MESQKKAMNTNVQAMEKNLAEIRESQNELLQAISEVYILLKKVGEKLKIAIPKPAIKMEVE